MTPSISTEDIWPEYEREAGGEEPEWLASEKEHFVTHRDKDGDGRLNKQELRDWIMPEDYDHAKAEATHLMYESDVDSVSRQLIPPSCHILTSLSL